mmetsp:Transcript_17674/g.31932  ORF Transcript_17674/g.31932 Transcript_17674/m.31932 type:complete len:215 (-) Transcript_17674:58-702(-)
MGEFLFNGALCCFIIVNQWGNRSFALFQVWFTPAVGSKINAFRWQSDIIPRGLRFNVQPKLKRGGMTLFVSRWKSNFPSSLLHTNPLFPPLINESRLLQGPKNRQTTTTTTTDPFISCGTRLGFHHDIDWQYQSCSRCTPRLGHVRSRLPPHIQHESPSRRSPRRRRIRRKGSYRYHPITTKNQHQHHPKRNHLPNTDHPGCHNANSASEHNDL